jgi:hypothetical protein
LIVQLSTPLSIVTVAIGAWLSLREYRLKVQAETRIAESEQIESDIKLLKLFTEIMDIAHGRGGYQISEKLIEKFVTPEVIQRLPGENQLKALVDLMIIHLPVGKAAQDAAIAAIGVLGGRHAVLRPIAVQALRSLTSFKAEVAQGYLDILVAQEEAEQAMRKGTFQMRTLGFRRPAKG